MAAPTASLRLGALPPADFHPKRPAMPTRLLYLTLSLMLSFGALACGSTPTSSVTPEAPMTDFFPYPVQRHALANGLKVLFIPMAEGTGVASYWTLVRTGSRDETEPGVTGFAHFFEHMMFRGSERFPGKIYDGIVKKLGADANAYTTDDYTAYHMAVASDSLPRVIEIEADRFQRLTYDISDFKTEAGAVYGEFRKGRTSPFSVLYEGLLNTAFDSHTYKHTTIGFEEDVIAMPQQFDYSKTFFQRFYRPENCIVLVTGDFDPAATLAEIETHYGDWVPGYEAPAIQQEPEPTGMRRVDLSFAGQTHPILAVMWRGERYTPDDKAMVAGQILGELALGEKSAIYRKLVLQEQRLDALRTQFGTHRDPKLWGAYAVVKDPQDIAAVELEIRDAIAAFADNPVPQAELDALRSRLRYRFLSQLQSASQVSSHIARIVAVTGDIDAINTYDRTLNALTPKDLQLAARRYFTEDRLTVARIASEGLTLPPAPERGARDIGALAMEPVLLPVESDPVVATQIYFAVGSAHDPKGKEGLAQLTARLIAEGGTQRLSYEALLDELYPLAAHFGASVDKEMTVFRGQAHRDVASHFAEHMLAVLTGPRFDEADFNRIKASMLSYLEKTLRYSSDEELGKAVLYEQIYRGTPYAHGVHGTIAGLSAITLDDVKDFWRTHYTRETATLGLAGGYDASLERRWREGLGALPSGGEQAQPEVQPEHRPGRQVTLVQKEGDATAISFGFPLALNRSHPDFYALWVAASWLGEHRNFASHLFQVIREARGLNYGDYAYIEAFPNGGRLTMPPTGVGRQQQIFEVWLRPVPEAQAHFTLRAGMREVEKLIKDGLSEEAFEGARSFLMRYILHYAPTNARRLGYALDDRFYGMDAPGHLARAQEMLASLSHEDVNRAIRTYLQAEDMHIVLVTQDAEGMKSRLANDTPSPLTYPEGITKSQAILDEDVIIGQYPLKIQSDQIAIVPVSEVFN